jgi:hypothetical protein
MSTLRTEPPCISYLDRHILRYNYDYLNADLADVIFVVNGKKFPAQSHILGGASDQFTSLIQDHFKVIDGVGCEARRKNQTNMKRGNSPR